MTKEEAFKQWRYNNPITYASRPQLHEAWDAACDWQKAQEDKEPYLWFDPDTYQISRFKPNRPTYIPLYEH